MRVRVSFFANLQLKMGREEMVLDMGPIEEGTVRDVLIKIAEVTDKEIPSLIISQDGELRGAVRIVREGKDLQFSGGLEPRFGTGIVYLFFHFLPVDRPPCYGGTF